MNALEKTAFIVNPKAANGNAIKYWSDINELAGKRSAQFQAYLTAGPGDAVQLTRQVLLKGAEVVVCVGGDGTLNEVVNGFMGKNSPIRPEAALGYIPCGTGVDFARSVSIARELDSALENIIARHIRTIDLGRLYYRDHFGRPSCRYFHNITSFGLGGEICNRVNNTSKVLGGFISFFRATLISILLYDKKRIRLRVDNTFEKDVIGWNVVVANGQYHGGGMWVAPEAVINDGLFQVTVIGDFNILEVFRHFPKLYNGQISKLAKVTTLIGGKVEAFSNEKVLLDVDGEQPGRLPIVIEIVPRVLRLIVNK